ncbi:MAG: peptidylprolyl isomerase [Nanoarchaeota archaeon]
MRTFVDDGAIVMPIKKGDKVKIEYTGTLANGEEFDSSVKHGAPLEVEAGAGQIIPGFDKELIGMEKGQEKTITIKPEEAYGHPHEELKKPVPRDQLPKDAEPKVGMMLVVGSPDGQKFPAKIIAVDDTTATLDLNHPLAGKTLIFKFKIIDIVSK